MVDDLNFKINGSGRGGMEGGKRGGEGRRNLTFCLAFVCRPLFHLPNDISPM